MMHHTIVYSILAIASFVLSFYGSRAGMVLGQLRLPLLVYCAPSPIIAIATNLTISAFGGLMGGINCIRMKLVDYKMLAMVAIPSALGGLFSFRLATLLNPIWLKLVIGIIMCLCAVEMLYRSYLVGANGIRKTKPRNNYFASIVWIILGALSGVSGLLLGSVRIPLMIRLLGADAKRALATSMVAGCLTGAASSVWAFYLGKINLVILLVAAPPTALGSLLGTMWVNKSNTAVVLRQLAYVIFISAVFLLTDTLLHAFHLIT